MNRPIEYWIALVTGMLIVIDRHRNKPALARALVAAISGGIGHSMSADFPRVKVNGSGVTFERNQAPKFLMAVSASNTVAAF